MKGIDILEWIQVSICCASEQIDEICAELLEFSVGGVEIEDLDDFNHFLQNDKQKWEYVDNDLIDKMNRPTMVKFYLTNDENGRAELAHIKNKLPNYTFTLTNVKEEDWENNWKEYYKPFWVKDKVLICPLWEKQNYPDALAVYMDPGSAFGTGTHETTNMCIEHLITYLKQGDTVLDIGCGSGILAIAAMRLGAKNAQLVDISPLAVKTARENGKANDLYEPLFTVKEGNLTDDIVGQYEMITANIIADIIIPLCKDIHNYMKESTVCIFSGVIKDRAQDVENALAENALTIKEKKTQGDWLSYAVIKK